MNTKTPPQLSFSMIRHLRTMAQNGRPLRALVMANEQGGQDLLFQVLYKSIASGIATQETAQLAHAMMGIPLRALPTATRASVTSALEVESRGATEQPEDRPVVRSIPTTFRSITTVTRRSPMRRSPVSTAKAQVRVRYGMISCNNP